MVKTKTAKSIEDQKINNSKTWKFAFFLKKKKEMNGWDACASNVHNFFFKSTLSSKWKQIQKLKEMKTKAI